MTPTLRSAPALHRWTHALAWAVRGLIQRDFVVALALVQDALDLNRFERLADRMIDEPQALPLYHRGADLLDYRDALHRWRTGEPATLGHQLARFYEGDATMEAVIPDTRWPMSNEGRWAQLRWRHSHDVRHVLLGLGTTVHEEALLHTFQLAQHFTWMGAMLIPLALIIGTVDGGDLLRTLRHLPQAWRAGRSASLIAFARLEWWMDQPIEEARSALNVGCLGAAYRGDGPFRPHRVTWVDQPEV